MAINQLVLAGDSLMSGLIGPGAFNAGGSTYSQGGKGSFGELDAARIANIAGVGPLVASGLIPVWQQYTTGSQVTVTGTTPTGVASTDAFDKAPYGGAPSALNTIGFSSNVTTIWKWTPPIAYRPIVGFGFDWIDYTSGGNWSYRVDGGAWTAMGQTLANDNKYCRFYVPTAVTATLEVRAGTAAGAGIGCLPVGPNFFFYDPTSANTNGIIFQNVAVPGTQLHDLVTVTSGDRMAFWDAVKLGTGWGSSTLTANPNLGTIVMHLNDVTRASISTWNTDLGTFNTRVSPLGPVGIMSPWEAATATYNQTQQTNYRAQTKTTAAALSPVATVLDIYDAWNLNGFTANAGAVAAGYLNADAIHESQNGHYSIAGYMLWWMRNNFFATSATYPSTYVAAGKQGAVQYAGKQAAVQYKAGIPVGVVPV